jgi:Nucleotidyltransferase of unknown function (DUF6036)
MIFAMSHELSSPWASFLAELDRLLEEPIELHCIGGFAVVAGYGLPRSTNDLDYRTLVPYDRVSDLQRMAGPGSALAQKHKLHVQHTGVESMPESYDERLTELFPGRFKNIRLFVPDPYDLVLSKLTRNIQRDREDVEFLARTNQLDPAVLRARYQKELRPIVIGPPSRHDATLEFWVEAYFAKSQG